MIGTPKPRPYRLERQERDASWKAADRQGDREAKRRSRGRCEVTVLGERCGRYASEIHHHIGGWKLRGRGASALAVNKTHCCDRCHPDITGNVLEHIAGNRYRRIV